MSIFRCACCCGPRERWSVDAWLWRPDNDELCCSLLCQCMLLVLSQISVHYAFINDPVDLVSTGFEMEHFKHGEYWVEVFCQTTFVPDEASSPIPANAQTSANVWERAAEPVWVHSFEFENSNMTGHEHDLTTKRPCCNMMQCVHAWCMRTKWTRCFEIGNLTAATLLLGWNTFEAKVLKTRCLRPFISAVWYFSFAMFDSLTEVDMYQSVMICPGLEPLITQLQQEKSFSWQK